MGSTHRLWVLGICVVSACALGSAFGQTDPLYLSDGDGHRLVVVQGGAIVNTFPAEPQERAFPIAVVDTIRTTGYWTGETGGEYQLDGTPTGIQYTLNEMSQNGMSDGTTDEEFNYGQAWFTGEVWQYDRDWQNGAMLFSAQGRYGGVTYDPTDDTFYLSADRDAGIRHYGRDGSLLGQFNTVGNLDWDLALEHSTGILWVSVYGTGTFHKYQKDGTYLGDVVIPNLDAASFFSGEFQIPEPASILLLGVGGLALLRRR